MKKLPSSAFPDKPPRAWNFVILLGVFVLLLLTSRDYGASYDEPGLYRYAHEARQAYAQATRGVLDFNYADPIQKYYGPFFLVAASFAADALAPLGWGEPDRWHFFYGLFFLVSLALFYRLARRWFSAWSALALSALFVSQPLIWGHAFMNPKDIPFLGFVILTLLLGLKLADRAADRLETPLPAENAHREWDLLPAEVRAALRREIRRTALATFSLWTFFFSLRWLAEALLTHPAAPLTKFFFRLAAFAPSLPPENYLKKLTLWGLWLAAALTLLLILILLALFLRRLPKTRARFLRPAQNFLFWLSRPQAVFAAAALGVTVSLRLTAGLLALTLAAIFVWRLRARALPLLLAYGFLSAAALILAWPFLWLNPLKNLLKSLAVMREFARPGDWYAYPRLLAWQWTEPALALILAGGLIFAWDFFRRRAGGEFALVFLGLSLIPLAALMAGSQLLYDNFRQVLFIWLGFFLLSGFAFEMIFRRLQAAPLRLALILLAVSAGMLAIFQLHPYEYIYYNSLAGGLSGAARQGLPGDYWGLSLRAAAHFLNENAPAEARILVCGPVDSLQADLRPDLSAAYGCDESVRAGFDYAVVNYPAQIARPFEALPAEFVIERQGVILARVLRLP
ncbi:MAG: hypothetical protein OHK0031_06540 [Anaerolineales bacterium]